jgi:uncharacterized membrane protein
MTATTADVVTEDPKRRSARRRMGSMLLFMGVLHVVVPAPFLKIIPKALGAPRFWNLLAAGAEAGAGALLLSEDPDKQRAGGWLATATIVGVYPANIDMALKAGPPVRPAAIAAWLRLPMQFPMIRQAYSFTKR